MIEQADAIEWLRRQPDDSIDLIISSPPYEDRRSYEGLPARHGQAWVDWMLDVWLESARVCKGLVAYVVEGKTKNFRYSATPLLLAADLHRAGFHLRKPPIFHRVGIPGSGGPDWWRNDYEFVICTSRGKLPWSDPTVIGGPCKYAPGGEMSHRIPSGLKVGERFIKTSTQGAPAASGEKVRSVRRAYLPPKLANPGNVIKCAVGGGKMGSPLAHENEAPFPESLVDPFIRCFCPPGGVVADPFSGSGTTMKVALALGRRFVGCDIRASQVALTTRRLEECDPQRPG